MHFLSIFTASQILWILTFAALLVLLVVLLGRDRVKRFPVFTTSIVLMALLLLTAELVLNRLQRITGTEIYLALSGLDAIVSLMVVFELARRAFRGASRLAWSIAVSVALALAATVLYFWGAWPAWKTLTASSQLAVIQWMELVSDKVTLLAGLLAIELGVLVVAFGRSFHAGWRSHVQQIVIGLSTVSLAQFAINMTLRTIGLHTRVQTQADYERLIGLRDKFIHANNAVYICALVWWIVWLWLDEPDAAKAADSEQKPEVASASEDRGAEPAVESALKSDKKQSTEN